jgi:putative phosphoribosyl transferase
VPVAAAMASRLVLPRASWSVRRIADPACPELSISATMHGWLRGRHLIMVDDVAAELSPLVDRLVALAIVDDLQAVGLWYEHFEQLQDEQVLALLNQQPPLRRRIGRGSWTISS